jgi:hypothetical protein
MMAGYLAERLVWRRLVTLAGGLTAAASPIAAFEGLASRQGYARIPGGPVEPRSRRCGGWTVRRR